jgi:hypothetical protein
MLCHAVYLHFQQSISYILALVLLVENTGVREKLIDLSQVTKLSKYGIHVSQATTIDTSKKRDSFTV